MRWGNRKKGRRFSVEILLLFFFFMSAISFAQEKVTLNLNQAIDRALKISPEIKETQFDLEISKTKKAEADAAQYPQMELIAYTGPSPRARGNQIESPDSNTKPVISGIFGATDFKIVQPLYTFGKISALREAASKGINVSKAKIDQKKGDIILRTKQLYYSILLGKNIRNHLLDIREELQTSIQKTERQIELESPGTVESDIYKLKTFWGQVEQELNTVERGISLAMDALKTSLGYGRETDLDIFDTNSEPQKIELRREEEYEMEARNLRPEFLQLRDGLLAKKALVEAERGNLYPQFYVAAIGSFADASNRDRVKNPFIYDYLQHSAAGVVVGFKWNFDLGITKGKVQEANLDYLRLVQTKSIADMGIPLQVRNALSELQEMRKNIEVTREAYKNAKKWLVTADANFDLGIGDARDLSDAAISFAKTKADYLRYLYNEKIGLANLANVTGRDVSNIK